MQHRAVACFTFDNMGEAADIGTGSLDTMTAHHVHPSIGTGYPNLYALLDRHGVRATFFVEGWNGEHHPDAVADVVRHGHELGMHGWLHEAWSGLERAVEEQLAARATVALERAAGARPVGFRAPGGARSAHTEAILSALGYTYDASLGNGMQPQVLPSGLAQIPFVWPCVDGFYYLRDTAVRPADVRDAWLRALEQTAERGGLFLVICHAFLTGVDATRLDALDAVMRAAVADPRVVVRTAGEIADALRSVSQPDPVA